MSTQTFFKITNKILSISQYSQESSLLEELNEPNKTQTLAFINANSMNEAVKNDEYATKLLNTDILLRDGIGVKILMKTLGLNPGWNMNGTDFIPKLINSQNTVAIYGTNQNNLDQAIKNLKLENEPNITYLNGFLNDDEYIKAAKVAKPQIIILGMGTPKQETLASLLKKNLDFPCTIISGGAIIDFLSGNISRAPKWMQKNGLEWLYRFIKEPKRLFKRYIIGNPLFIYRTLRVYLLAKKLDKYK